MTFTKEELESSEEFSKDFITGDEVMREKALNINGQYTYCSLPKDQRGKGRCNHLAEIDSAQLRDCINSYHIHEIDVPLMSIDDNILLADKQKIDSIHSAAESEGVACTYAQTEEVINGQNSGLNPKDTRIIESLNNAMDFTLDKNNLAKEIDLNYILTIHDFLYLSGTIEISNPERYKNWRNDSVAIGGTEWRPDPFSLNKFSRQLNELKALEPLERALAMFELIAKAQPFKDCNKRTAMLVANHELIKNGRGLLLIKKEFDAKYKELLIHYYETDNKKSLEKFLLANCWLHNNNGLPLCKEK